MCRHGSTTCEGDSACTQRPCADTNTRKQCSYTCVSDEEEVGHHYCEDDTLKCDHLCTNEDNVIDKLKTDCDAAATKNHVPNKINNFSLVFLTYIFIFMSILNTLQLVLMHPGSYKDLWLNISRQDIKYLHDNESRDDLTKDVQNKSKLAKSGNRKIQLVEKTIQFLKGIIGPSWWGTVNHERKTNNLVSYSIREWAHLKPFTEEQSYKALKSTGIFELRESSISDSQPAVFPVFSSLNNYLTRVQNEGSVPLDEEMCYEVRRLQSYSAVPVRTSPMRLAQSGFYATGSGDETRCYSCRMTHSGWKLMDQPDQIHRSVSPECQHLNRRDQRNVPIAPSGSEDATSVCSVMESYPVTTVSSEPFPSGASASAPLTWTPAVTSTTPMATTASPMTTTTTTAASSTSGSSDLPGLDISKAVYPQYRDLSRRLDSYKGWGSSHVQDHQVLARAGFYYAGYRDCVRCFYCGVGLRTWEREDDPWVEHVRWRSSCDYVRLMRGEQFVIQALANGLSVAMASSQQSECSQLQSSQQSMSGYGTGAVSKAEEMGFQRDHIERAVVELTGTHSTTRDNIPLETLLEKLVIMSEQPVTTTPTTYSSIPAVHSSSSAFSTPQSQPISVTVTTLYGSKGSSPEGSRKEMTSSSRNSHTGTAVNVTSSVNMAESQTGAPFTVTSTEQLAPNNSISSGLSSVTNQKAVESSHTKGGSREPAVLSASQERQLEEENQSLRDEGTCKICLDNPSCIVFLPCGHLVTCAECAPALRKCPICRALIRGSVRAHTVSSEDVNI